MSNHMPAITICYLFILVLTNYKKNPIEYYKQGGIEKLRETLPKIHETRNENTVHRSTLVRRTDTAPQNRPHTL